MSSPEIGGGAYEEYSLEEETILDLGLLVRITNYTDIDEARAAAERLAEEEG